MLVKPPGRWPPVEPDGDWEEIGWIEFEFDPADEVKPGERDYWMPSKASKVVNASTPFLQVGGMDATNLDSGRVRVQDLVDALLNHQAEGRAILESHEGGGDYVIHVHPLGEKPRNGSGSPPQNEHQPDSRNYKQNKPHRRSDED